MNDWTLAHLQHPDSTLRRKAMESLPDSLDLGYALRDRLLFDELGPLRALAADRLGRTKDPRWTPWLQEALGDPLQTVREAACASLGRLGSEDAAKDLHEAATSDPNWRARRAATHALLACLGPRAIDSLREVLFDPFWRVRHAAVKGLQWIGEADPKLRSLILAPLPHLEGQQALRYLRFQWQLEEPSADAQAPTIKDEIALSAPLNNPDPAVVAKILIEKPKDHYSSQDLCYVLADSHEALRKAAHGILLSRDIGELLPVLRWLEIPGPPRAAEQSLKLLHELRHKALPLVEAALRDPSHGSPGAMVWALGWVIQNRHESLFEKVIQASEHIDERVRQAAAAGLSELVRAQLDSQGTMEARLLVLIKDSSPRVRKDALFGLLRNEKSEVIEALSQFQFEKEIPNARVSLIRWALKHGHKDWLEAALSDPHPAVQANVIATLNDQASLDDKSRVHALNSEDPWIRASALNLEQSWEALPSDPSSLVRRAAARILAEAPEFSPEEKQRAAQILAQDQDPALRAKACSFLREGLDNTENHQALRLALELSQDQELSVRASTREALDALPSALPRLLRLLSTLDRNSEADQHIEKAAWSRLIKEDKSEVKTKLFERLEQDPPPAVKDHLIALSLIFSDQYASSFQSSQQRSKRKEKKAVPNIELRELGKTGLKVSPLAISGAQNLAFSGYRHAKDSGVNLFFWEPLYAELTRFLKSSVGRSSHVIAGTFHAHKEGIVKDVETALRRLKRDSLDIFLYFWARSDQRLNDEAFEIMAELKRQGKIKAAGFSTHHRDMALRAIQSHPWDVVMTRHSAAHLGSEKELFPALQAHGVGLLTFSNLCYGRMLKSPQHAPELTPPSAADCYRYSLSQPGVTASISAPRRFRELEENLEVLKQSTLNAEEIQRMRRFGAEVYSGNKGFNKLIRQPGMMKTLRELALDAIERELGLPPGNSESPRPLPSAMMDLVQKETKQQPASLPSAVIRRGRE